MDELRIQAAGWVSSLGCERDVLELLEREVIDRTGARWADGRIRAQDTVEVLANELRGEIGEFIEEYADDDDVAERWQDLVEGYSERLQEQVALIVKQTLVCVRLEVEQLVEELAVTPGIGAGLQSDADFTGCRRGWEDACRWISRVAPVVIVRLPLPPHIKIVLTVATSLLSILMEVLVRWTRSRRVADLLTALQDCVQDGENQASDQMRDWFTQAELDLRRQLRTFVGVRVAALANLEHDLRNLTDRMSSRFGSTNGCWHR